MKLLAITDLHDRRATLQRILADAGPVDLVLIGGDITNFGSVGDAQRVIRAAQAVCARVLAVAGNCDSPAIDQALVEMGISLHGRGVVIDGVGFCGLSGMPPWKKGMYQFTEEELAAALQAGHAQSAAGPVQVVLAHPPPRGERIDRTNRGSHAGSTALRAFIDAVQPRLVFCGHIHEGRGIEQIGRTTAINCGPGLSGSYALVELGSSVTAELRNA